MLDYDPTRNLIHHPTAMAKYGLNPYGENRYRIVSTATRRNLIGGYWHDNGATEYRWDLTYEHIKQPWVLEAWAYCKHSRDEWNRLIDPVSGWPINGPFPDRGEYYLAFIFRVSVEDCNLDKLIMWIEAGAERSFQDRRGALKAEYEADTKDRQGRIDAIVRNALPAFLDRPMVGFGGGRGTKTAPIIMNASQVRLPSGRQAPVGPNKFVNVPRKRLRPAV